MESWKLRVSCKVLASLTLQETPSFHDSMDIKKNWIHFVNPFVEIYVSGAQKDDSFEYLQHVFCLRNVKI